MKCPAICLDANDVNEESKRAPCSRICLLLRFLLQLLLLVPLIFWCCSVIHSMPLIKPRRQKAINVCNGGSNIVNSACTLRLTQQLRFACCACGTRDAKGPTVNFVSQAKCASCVLCSACMRSCMQSLHACMHWLLDARTCNLHASLCCTCK